MKAFKTILITGATGAIGAAFAQYYAQAGVTLLLQGRKYEVLKQLANTCQQQGANVKLIILDLRDSNAVRQWAEQITQDSLPDLVIANAGVNYSAQGHGLGENWEQVSEILDINIKSTIALINTIALAMRQRQSGQIAIISSLAGFYGLPVTPSYCASKAALKAYGEALRGGLAKYQVGVTVIMPGYVQSAMCDAMLSPKPFLWSANRAVFYIAKRLVHNPARISFPFPLNLGTGLLAVIPSAWAQYFVRLLGYGHY